MVGTQRLLFLTLVIVSFFSWTAQAQDQNSQSSFNFESGLGNAYFVDEAGLQLMQNVSPLDEFIDPETYVLGPYDVLSIMGSGLNEFTYRTIAINASGDVILPVVGRISLRGLTLADAQNVVNSHFANYFKSTETTVTLDAPRPVTVHIGGNIQNPGRYTIPAGFRYDALVSGFLINDVLVYPLTDATSLGGTQINTSRPSVSGIDFEKLSARTQKSQGNFNSVVTEIDNTYDLRLIKVTKPDGYETYIDLKAYFNSGNKIYAPFIQDGDQVTMIANSSARPLISISGAVNSPFTGTYRIDDTLEKLVAIAGGYLPEADSATVIRIREDGISVTKEELLVSNIQTVQPGDKFIIPFVESSANKGTVQLFGEISIPGSYPITIGETTLSQILDMADGFTENALKNGAYLVRETKIENGVPQLNNSNLSMLSKSSDQFVEGMDYLELEETLSPNRMPLNLLNSTVAESVTLFDGDRIYIPEDQHTVTLLGQINNPGYYPFDPQMSARDYISKSGGITIAAAPERIFVIKAGSKTWYAPENTELQSGDIVFVDRVPFEDVSTGRNHELQLQQLKNNRVQLIISGVATIASIITAYAAIARLSQ